MQTAQPQQQHVEMELPHLLQLLMTKSCELDAALAEVHRCARNYAEKDRDYRRERAKVIVKSTGRNKDQREAEADLECWEDRFHAKLAEGLLDSAKEASHARRVQVTALQTAINAVRQEMAFAQTGPQYTP